MRNKELIKSFLNGATRGRGSNMYIDGDKLIEWSTCLAQRVSGGYILNTSHYSRTTSRWQGDIKYYAGTNVVAVVDDLDFGVRDLTRYAGEPVENFM